jgi:adenylate kinase
MRMILCGLSGVGKDKLLDEVSPYLKEREIKVVAFGEMLFKELSEDHTLENRDNLVQINDCDKKLAIHRCIGSLTAYGGNQIINTHLVRVNYSGIYHGIEAARMLLPTSITCIEAEPRALVERKTSDMSRRRVALSISQIEEVQRVQHEVVIDLASEAGVGYRFIDNTDTDITIASSVLKELIKEEE